jgi:hypothetical protein
MAGKKPFTYKGDYTHCGMKRDDALGIREYLDRPDVTFG